MSRSCRHTPIIGVTCCESEKRDKVLAHRRLRRATHTACAIQWDYLECWYRTLLFPHERRYSDPWLYGKDGKGWIAGIADLARYLRK